MIYSSVASLEQAAYEITGRSQLLPLFKEPVIQDQKFAKQVQSLFQSLMTSTSALAQETQLLWTLVALIQTYAKISSSKDQWEKAEPQAVCQVKEFLQTNYADNPS